ncbi:PQQ-dependent sugar dehydrogenase [Pedobacter sp. SYSU D00535]|uniref:PQQ-dependent sugar dehydrogenase n=1 Tax=Pedobacter sp. SYSU D00535 TaxID=2810308 RepID=UPI001A97C0FA|nr:PQQ-dependent sugar dehydrogenase [Pedobacter sp. SYSU D00535]
MRPLFQTFLLFIVFTLVACSSKPQSESPPQSRADTAGSEFETIILYENLKNPWGMAWLPDDRLLVTERSGEILVFEDDKFSGIKLSGVPEVFAKGQGGLLDIKLHPNYAKNGWLYLAYAKPMPGGATTALMRAKLQGNQLVEKTDIFTATPVLSADYHFGSRIAFDNENYLFLVVGERGTKPKVQQLDNDHGKIHRIFDDGRVPDDNPFANQEGARKSIWSYGHRNPQGMAYDAESNRLWAVEHGPKGGDELNLIEKGKNYGWPSITYGIDYDGSIISDKTEMPGMEQPVKYWNPSIAPCGMALVTSDKYPAWRGNLLIGALAHRHVARVELEKGKFASEEKLLADIGRVRHIAQSPDGFIYVLTEGPGQLIKLVSKQ